MASFRKDFISGVLYTSAAKYIGIIVSMVVTIVLARILDPEDFAVIAIAVVILNFLNLLTDFGLGPAIIQNDELSESDIKSLFNFTILLGIVGGGFLLLFSVPIAEFYGNIQLVSVIRLLSINIFFISLNTVPNALLLKQKQFRLIAKRTLAFQLSAGVIAIICAYCGFGVYALVLQYMVSNVGVFIYNYICAPIPLSFELRATSINKIINFSLFQFFSSIISFVSKETDKLLIGKRFEFNQLGYYEKSYRLIQLPVNNLITVFNPVIQPLFKDLDKNNHDFDNKFMALIKYLSLLSFPLASLMYFTSSDIIFLFYGPKWEPAIAPFRMLCIAIGFQIVMSVYFPVMQASGKVRVMLLCSIIEFGITISFLSIGLMVGTIKYVALCISLGAFVYYLVSTFILGKYVLNQPVDKVYRAIFPGIMIAILCIIPEIFISKSFDGLFSVWRFLINIFVVALIVFLYTYTMKLIPWNKILLRLKKTKKNDSK